MQAVPVTILAKPGACVIGSETGEWAVADRGDRITPLPATGPFGAAVLDTAGSLIVSCWAPVVQQLRAGARTWEPIELGATPLALVATPRGVISGDATGGLAIVPTSSRISVQELTAAEPVVELCSTDDGLAILGASGALEVTGWPFRATETSPYRDGAQLARVDTAAIGRPYGLFPGVREGSAIVAGRRGIAALAGNALAYVVVGELEVRGVVRFAGADRACLFTDGGEAWILDPSLARVTRVRTVDIAGASAMPDGTVLIWTHHGDLALLASDGAVRGLAGRDVVGAAPDPDRASGYLAVHWTATDGVSLSRGGAWI
ncbi:MAG: hypothetical protein NT062_25920 [Proteobacteria bacterium]|nr:hypothetical protein [Pseudomonadota bacterium]